MAKYSRHDPRNRKKGRNKRRVIMDDDFKDVSREWSFRDRYDKYGIRIEDEFEDEEEDERATTFWR